MSQCNDTVHNTENNQMKERKKYRRIALVIGIVTVTVFLLFLFRINRALGFILALYSAAEIVLSVQNVDPDRWSRGWTLLVIGCALVALPPAFVFIILVVIGLTYEKGV